MIAGGVVGGVAAALLLLILLIVCCCCWKHQCCCCCRDNVKEEEIEIGQLYPSNQYLPLLLCPEVFIGKICYYCCYQLTVVRQKLLPVSWYNVKSIFLSVGSTTGIFKFNFSPQNLKTMPKTIHCTLGSAPSCPQGAGLSAPSHTQTMFTLTSPRCLRLTTVTPLLAPPNTAP